VVSTGLGVAGVESTQSVSGVSPGGAIDPLLDVGRWARGVEVAQPARITANVENPAAATSQTGRILALLQSAQIVNAAQP